MADKRKYRRLPLEPISCRVFQDVKLVDLSIGGAFVASDRPLPRGSTFVLEATLPGQRTIRARSRVERVGDFFEGEGGAPLIGMGLSFVEVTAADRIAITRFLASVYDVAHEARRVRADLAARVLVNGSADDWQAGRVRDMAERTLFLATEAVAPLGAEVNLLLRLPNARRPVEVRGVVLEVASPVEARRHAGAAGPEPLLIDPASEERGLRIEIRGVGPDNPVRDRELLAEFLEDARREQSAARED